LSTRPHERRWQERYPPLVGLAVALLLVIAVLPSALNQPQSNPTTTPEYAPVPPQNDQQDVPPGGNLASLGLASSANVTHDVPAPTGGNAPLPPTAQNLAASGKTPSTKRCVGQPPRQTEDPLSPPCVADFRGDNGGATYQGVSRDEIRVLFYYEGCNTNYNSSAGPETPPCDKSYDLAEPPQGAEHVLVRVLRVYQRYFNDRFQTYNRAVHFYLYFSNNRGSAEARRADAAATFNDVHPFAVMTELQWSPAGPGEPFVEDMARRGVLTFGSFAELSAEFYRRYPSYIWTYQGSIEQQAEIYGAYVCKRVVPYPSSFSGNAGDNGNARRLGLLSTTDPKFPDLQLFAQIVRARVKGCGGNIVDEETFPQSGFYNADNPNATSAMTTFKQKQVSTVIWAGGYETINTHAAAATGFQPEWIVAGDRLQEADNFGQKQDQGEWARAWVVTAVARQDSLHALPCWQTYKEVDPAGDDTDILNACDVYNDIRQLFTGIQVAGPRLSPSSVDAGFHAIPRISSDDPHVPACFYETADYSCVKDAVAEWWDTSTQAPGSSVPGCWRMPDGGRRYLGTSWRDGDVPSDKRAGDPCNAFRTFVV
jgi:hypothetical protein